MGKEEASFRVGILPWEEEKAGRSWQTLAATLCRVLPESSRFGFPFVWLGNPNPSLI